MNVYYTYDSSENCYCTHLFIPYLVSQYTHTATMPTDLIWTRTTPTGYDFTRTSLISLPIGVVHQFPMRVPMIGKKYRMFCYNWQSTIPIADSIRLFLEASHKTPDTYAFIPFCDLGYKEKFSKTEIAEQITDGLQLFREQQGNPLITVFIGVTRQPEAVRVFKKQGILLMDRRSHDPIM